MGLFDVNLSDIRGIFDGIGSLAKDIRAAITGKAPIDATKAAELEAKVLELEQLGMQAQAKINEIEAGHPSLFVAGWRPAVGWICALGLFYQTIVNPTIQWVVNIYGLNISAPLLNTETLMTILLGLLGLAGYRTYEKSKGVQDQH